MITNRRDLLSIGIGNAAAIYNPFSDAHKVEAYLDDFLHESDPWKKALSFADILYVAPGQYSRSMPLQVPNGKKIIAFGVTLNFAGSISELNTNEALVTVGEHVSIIGLTLKVDSKIFFNSYGIASSSHCYFRGVTVDGASNTGWNIYRCTSVILDECISINNRVGVYISDSRHVRVLNQVSRFNSGEGLLVQKGRSFDILVSGGVYSNNGDSGVSVSAGNSNGVIENLIANHNRHQGIELQSSMNWRCQSVVCSFNSQCGILISDYYEGAVSRFFYISKFLCNSNGEAGLQISGSSFVYVVDGLIQDNGRSAVGRYFNLQIVQNAETKVPCMNVIFKGVSISVGNRSINAGRYYYCHPSSVRIDLRGVAFHDGIN